MKELVSVIIPTYKRSECLIRAINSVLIQTYTNVEIIVVDDNDENSTYRKDNKKKLENYINNNKIIYITHKKNMNGANARNTGIKAAKGVYITFLDDDDYFLPDRIEKLVKILKTHKNYGGAYSSVIFEDKEGIITNLFHADNKKELQKIVLSGKGFFGTGSNMFFRKSVLDKVGMFDGNFKRHQDLEYMVRFLEESNIINLDEFLVVKSNYDGINVPNYQVLFSSKERFLKKFENIINKYDADSRREIYVKHLYNLYSNAPYKEKKRLLNVLKSYGEKKYMVYSKNLRLYIKNSLKKIKIVRVINMIHIKGKKYQILLSNLKSSLEEMKS